MLSLYSPLHLVVDYSQVNGQDVKSHNAAFPCIQRHTLEPDQLPLGLHY